MKIKQKEQYDDAPCWAFAVVDKTGVCEAYEVSYVGVPDMSLEELVPMLEAQASLPVGDKYVYMKIPPGSLSGRFRFVVTTDGADNVRLLSVPRVGWVWSDTTVGPRLRAGAMAEHEMHENFGPPCETVAPGCCTCDAWGMFTMGGEVR